MYVCVCNAITDSDVREAKALGAMDEDDIFDHFGVEPLCGRCCDMMGEMLDGHVHAHSHSHVHGHCESGHEDHGHCGQGPCGQGYCRRHLA